MSLLSNRKSILMATVTGISVFILFGYITLKPEPPAPKAPEYNFVVTKNTIKKGDVIKEEDVAIKSFPMNIQGGHTATGEVVGRKASQDIVSGQPVMSDFVEKIKAKASADATPNSGFRTVPVMISTDVVPKDITPDMKFDFISTNNLLEINNVRILEVTSAQSAKGLKIVHLEIKDKDVQPFLESMKKITNVNILRKNPDDYGEYKFKSTYIQAKQAYQGSSSVSLPPIDKLDKDLFKEYRRSGQVEVIVGSSKKTMEFDE